MAVITFSLFEVSSSTRVSFSTSLWKLLTSPVGKVAFVRWPSESYLQDMMLESHEIHHYCLVDTPERKKIKANQWEDLSTLCNIYKDKNWSLYSLKMHSIPNPNYCLGSFSVVLDKTELGIVWDATFIMQLLPEVSALHRRLGLSLLGCDAGWRPLEVTRYSGNQLSHQKVFSNS